MPWEYAQEAQTVLETSLAHFPEHSALLSMYIHLMETSSNPGKAKAAADALCRVAPPDCGYLLHVPTHIYRRLGDYAACLHCGRRAVNADSRYQELSDIPNPNYTIYRMHNMHHLMYSAMICGQYQLAMECARSMTSLDF